LLEARANLLAQGFKPLTGARFALVEQIVIQVVLVILMSCAGQSDPDAAAVT